MSKLIFDASNISDSLSSANIPHTLGGASLYGFSEGNFLKYTDKVHFYIYNYSLISIIRLFFILIKYKIFLKPKLNKSNHLYFKLRKKETIFSKSHEYFLLHRAANYKNKYRFSIGNRFRDFEKKDFDFSKTLVNSYLISMPVKLKFFIKKYQKNLLGTYYKKYSVYLNKEYDVGRAINMLTNVTKVLNDSNYKYWLDGGTLLGAVRDNALIPWDHDLDIAIQYESDERLDELIRLLKKKYYVRAITFSKKESIWNLGKYRCIKTYEKKMLSRSRDGLWLDIFVFYRQTLSPSNNEMVYKYGVWGQNAYYSHDLLDQLSTITFYNNTFSVPGKVEKYLESKYGTSWKKPKKDWNVVFDDQSIVR